jgi:hypothetical protein
MMTCGLHEGQNGPSGLQCILLGGNDQFTGCGVLHTKQYSYHVPDTIFILRMCLATFRVCCRQISQLKMLPNHGGFKLYWIFLKPSNTAQYSSSQLLPAVCTCELNS